MNTQMKRYSNYVERLERLLEAGPGPSSQDWSARCAAALDGEPGRELRKAISLKRRRSAGAFFTGSVLARKAVVRPRSEKECQGKFCDPACGAGDLLLAAARLLPVRRSLTVTVALWGQRLMGCDVHPEFIRAAKARLVLLAQQRGARPDGNEIDLEAVFPLIGVGDGLTERRKYRVADWILLNPPYVAVPAAAGCKWGSGKVSSAAVFLEKAVVSCRPGTKITAIVPDVLRTGSRYGKWRDWVAAQGKLVSIGSWGLFDALADVDVFVVTLIKRERLTGGGGFDWVAAAPRTGRTVGDLFDVRVGPVVPFRLKKGEGKRSAFLHAKGLPRWKRVRRIGETREFKGTLYKAPFVVVRRTSRPEDAQRAVATLVTGRRAVAVENHLLICVPRSGTVKDCEGLMRRLKLEQTSRFLNQRIRCRHLTVSAVRELPWWKA